MKYLHQYRHGQLVEDFNEIIQGAKNGLETDELMSQLDAKIQYGGAQKLTEFEMELLDQIDRMCDTQIELQTNLKNEKNSNEQKRVKLENFCVV